MLINIELKKISTQGYQQQQNRSIFERWKHSFRITANEKSNSENAATDIQKRFKDCRKAWELLAGVPTK